MKIEYDSTYGIQGTVVLVRNDTDEIPDATFLRPMVLADGDAIARQWPALMRRMDGSRFADAGWNWKAIVSRAVNKRGWFGLVVQKGTLMQGAVVGRTPFKLLNGDRGVFIERLATAPWNRKNNLVNNGVQANKLVGSWLLFGCIASSLFLGNHGRCALDSYREAEDFYKSAGLVARPHGSYQRYYEVDPKNNPVTVKWISNLLSL